MLSREEKKKDKEKMDSNVIVYVYDLQAVMPIRKGEILAFYDKSKLNIYNFTIYDLKTNDCECYVWEEANGHRGVNELGTCLLKYFEEIAAKNAEFIFYSDNCAGQNKNKYILTEYLYTISHYKIKSIVHKYLIKGHSQNVGDSVHSLIERQVQTLIHF